MAQASKGKQFRLTISNAAEDYPRLLLGKGIACGGTFVLAVRLDTSACLLTHKVGKIIRVYASDKGGVPRMPSEIVENQAAADNLLVALKRDLPKLREPARRGTWSATLFCDDKPIIMLERKVAAYGVIRICSDPDRGRWDWKAERAERWYGGREDKAGHATSLHKAIEEAYAASDGLVSTACVKQATQRRAAHDSAFAAEHPNKLARERPDPTAPRKKKNAEPAAPPARAKKAEPAPEPEKKLRASKAAAADTSPPPKKPRASKGGADREAELMKLMTAGIQSAVRAAAGQ